MEQSRNAYTDLVGKPEGKRPLGKARRRQDDNIKMNFSEVSCDAGDWIAIAEYSDQRLAYERAKMNLLESQLVS